MSPSILSRDKLKLLKYEEEPQIHSLGSTQSEHFLLPSNRLSTAFPLWLLSLFTSYQRLPADAACLNPGCSCRSRLLRGHTTGPDVLQLTEGCSATASGCSHFWKWCGTAGVALARYSKDRLRWESRYGPDISFSLLVICDSPCRKEVNVSIGMPFLLNLPISLTSLAYRRASVTGLYCSKWLMSQHI